MNWQTKKLGELSITTDFVANGSFASLKSNVNYLTDGYAILVRTTDLQNNFLKRKVYIDENAYKYLNKSKLFGGELILSSVGSVGSVFICPKLGKPMSLGPNAVMIRPTDEVLNLFLYYFFLSPTGQQSLKRISSATTQSKFNKTNLRNEEIPLPPLKTQKEIVSELDAKFTKLKEAKRLREEALADTEKILFQTIGEILDNLKSELINLGDISKMVSGGTPSRSNPQYWEGGTPWVSSGELNNIYIFETKEKITDEGLKNSNAKLLPTGSLLIGMYDTAALKMSICKKEITTNQAIIGLLPNNNKFISEFIYYQLTYLRPEIMKIRQGVRQKNLNSRMIKAIKIKLPSLSEQQKIVTKLDKLSEKIKTLRELQTSQLADLKRLEKSYLREAFNSELV